MVTVVRVRECLLETPITIAMMIQIQIGMTTNTVTAAATVSRATLRAVPKAVHGEGDEQGEGDE